MMESEAKLGGVDMTGRLNLLWNEQDAGFIGKMCRILYVSTRYDNQLMVPFTTAVTRLLFIAPADEAKFSKKHENFVIVIPIKRICFNTVVGVPVPKP